MDDYTIMFLIYVGLFFFGVILVRFFGAWMLRINDVIKNQEKQISLLQKLVEKDKMTKP